MFKSQDIQGLSENEALSLLKKDGPNSIKENPPPSDIEILIRQIKSPLVYVLIGALSVTLILREVSDSLIIFAAILINSVLGFIQERKANHALHALKALVKSNASVIREGKLRKIDASFLVRGDIVVLNQGDKVPADGVILEANRLFIEEAILTGESEPVTKKDGNDVSMATIVVSGRGLMKVMETGVNTKVGKIADKVQVKEEHTPLKKQLTNFSKLLAYLVLFLTVGVFLIGLLTGREINEMVKASVALAVSAIPEGLLVGLTVVLAIGMQRILKRKGLVRNLVSAETLGGVTTICLDKTGTLTEGKLKVVSFLGDKRQIAMQSLIANDMDDPIVITAHNWASAIMTSSPHLRAGYPARENDISESNSSHRLTPGAFLGSAIKDHKKLLERNKRLDSIPFSSKDRYFACLNISDTRNNTIYVNGAPEYLLEWVNISKKEKDEIKKKIKDSTTLGYRLVGLIQKKVDKNKSRLSDGDIKVGGYEWVGMLSFFDPIRQDVKNSLQKAVKAGIKLVVITGDYLDTALSVANKVGLNIDKKESITGKDLAKLNSYELSKMLGGDSPIRLFARTTPEQKSKIVEALKKNGEVVAMMGDGVNDAPALKNADIGIVVGEASDVARETADLVLLDSKFDTVISAIEEGRGIFDNIRKIILYLMSTAFNAITAVVGALLLGLPLPVTAAQILWINLVSNGFPDLALTVDPKREGIMDEPPRSSNERLVAKWMNVLIAIVSITSGLMALGLFLYTYRITDNLELSQTVAFVSLGFNSLIYVFSIRTLKEPFWKEGLFVNKWLILAVLAGLFLQVIPLIFTSARLFFGTTILPLNYWILIVSISILTFGMIEIIKAVFRKKLVYI